MDADILEAAATAIRAVLGVDVKAAGYRKSYKKPPRHPVLRKLLEAKAESDRGNYKAKHAIMRGLMAEEPHKFKIDSEDKGIVGITHADTNFRMHLPKSTLPTALLRARS